MGLDHLVTCNISIVAVSGLFVSHGSDWQLEFCKRYMLSLNRHL